MRYMICRKVGTSRVFPVKRTKYYTVDVNNAKTMDYDSGIFICLTILPSHM
jgi:hypothetical protein